MYFFTSNRLVSPAKVAFKLHTCQFYNERLPKEAQAREQCMKVAEGYGYVYTNAISNPHGLMASKPHRQQHDLEIFIRNLGKHYSTITPSVFAALRADVHRI